MNKNDLVSAVANNAGLSKVDAAKAVDGVFDTISGALSSGGDVRIVGFGTFLVTNRAATTGRNPRTGESIQIPAKIFYIYIYIYYESKFRALNFL